MPDSDYSKLKGKIIEVCGSLGAFCEAMGWSMMTQLKKMTGRTPWTQKDIFKAVTVLKIEIAEIPAYFFTLKVQN